MADFVGEEDDDLSFRKGECVYIIDRGYVSFERSFCRLFYYCVSFSREDGWWVAENSDGQQGLVPSNYLKVGVVDFSSNVWSMSIERGIICSAGSRASAGDISGTNCRQ